MTSMIVTGLLAGVGKLFADNGKNPRGKKIVRQQIPENERPNGPMVYESNRLLESEGHVQQLAHRQAAKAQQPISTNVIPPLFNTMQQERVDQFHSKNKQAEIFNGPMFQDSVTEGFDQSTHNTLSGRPIENYHNNMVPFHGLKHNPNTANRMTEGKLERFTGFGELIERPKREIGRFFNLRPQDIRNTTHAPDDLREERYVAALTNNKTNLLPAPQVREAPFEPLDFRPELRPVEELRVKSNPKISYEGRTIHGINEANTTYGNLGDVRKHRPQPLIYDGMSHSVPGSAEVRKPKINDTFILRNTNKEQLLENRFNGANATEMGNRVGMCRDPRVNQTATPCATLDGQVRESFKSEVENPVGNIPINVAYEQGTRRPYDKARITLRNLRQVQRKGNVGNSVIQNSMGHIIQQKRTKARPTHRQTARYQNYRGPANSASEAMMDRSFVTGGFQNQYGGACITDRKETLLKNRMPGPGRGTHFIGSEDINMAYTPGTSDIPGYTNRWMKTDNRWGAAKDLSNAGAITNMPYKKTPECAGRFNDIPAIVSQLDTNSLVIRNDV